MVNLSYDLNMRLIMFLLFYNTNQDLNLNKFFNTVSVLIIELLDTKNLEKSLGLNNFSFLY